MNTKERVSFRKVTDAAGLGTGDAKTEERVPCGRFYRLGKNEKRRVYNAMA
jgi:hypothetical protein